MAKRPREPLKSRQIYQTLRRRILSMEIQPGALLNKEPIAKEFDVSIAPVGYALMHLAEEGLVEVRPQHGSFVSPLTPENVREGLFIRTALEVEAVRQAALLGDEELCEALRTNLEEQEKALQENDIPRLQMFDEAMHALIFGALKHDRASRILESARAPVDRMRRFVLPIPGRPEVTVQEHRWIVHAICTGNPELAGAAMRAHLDGLKATFEKKFNSARDAAE